tara:strand:+ start:7012 stop:8061 length:1050 start_codon:yes stop_codon:yes gene_type:complete
MASSKEKRSQRHQSQLKQNISQATPRGKVTEHVAGSGYRETQYIGGKKYYTPLSTNPNSAISGTNLSASTTSSSVGITSHGSLNELLDDDHTQYILVNGTRAFSGNLIVGSDGSGHDVTFYSGTAGDSFVWDSSEELLTITGTNGQTALNIADGNVTIADTLTSSNIGAYTLTGKLTAGAQEIEGSAFDIDGGDLSAITISGGLTWSSAQDLNSQTLTNVNIDSGTIDGTTIGANSHNTIKGTTIEATTNFNISRTTIASTLWSNTATLTIDTTSGLNLQEDGTNVISFDTNKYIYFHNYGNDVNYQNYALSNLADKYHFTTGRADLAQNYSILAEDYVSSSYNTAYGT